MCEYTNTIHVVLAEWTYKTITSVKYSKNQILRDSVAESIKMHSVLVLMARAPCDNSDYIHMKERMLNYADRKPQ